MFLKLLDQFTYLSSNLSSTETDVNICRVKEIRTVSVTWWYTYIYIYIVREREG